VVIKVKNFISLNGFKKVNFAVKQAMKAQWKSGGIALLFL
jgi:hypothetical protein